MSSFSAFRERRIVKVSRNENHPIAPAEIVDYFFLFNEESFSSGWGKGFSKIPFPSKLLKEKRFHENS